jgi:hypothetical protein
MQIRFKKNEAKSNIVRTRTFSNASTIEDDVPENDTFEDTDDLLVEAGSAYSSLLSASESVNSASTVTSSNLNSNYSSSNSSEVSQFRPLK